MFGVFADWGKETDEDKSAHLVSLYISNKCTYFTYQNKSVIYLTCIRIRNGKSLNYQTNCNQTTFCRMFVNLVPFVCRFLARWERC